MAASTAQFSFFRTATAKYRKSCRWCGARCYMGITIHHRGRSGTEMIRGFCCLDCAAQIGDFVRQTNQSGEA